MSDRSSLLRPPFRAALIAAIAMAAPMLAPAAALAQTPAAPLRPATPAAQRIVLPDSTVIETFTLSNGLRVITRHVPLSSAIAMTLAFDGGDRDDPEGRPGLARLAGRLRFFAATGIEPARTREQMDRLRPAGWDLLISARATRISEVATLGQFPGMLHQMAARLRGVEFTEPEMRAMAETVRQDLLANYRDSLDRALVFRARALAEGADDDAIAKRASGAGLQSVSLREVRDALAQQGTRQTVLSLAGDMNAYPMRQLIESEFGRIPESKPSPATLRQRPLQAGQRQTTMPGLSFPLAAVGVLAPSLADTLHPEFYAASLRLGTYMLSQWGRPDPPFSSRFRYQPFDDPELALFFPPLTIEGLTVPQLREEFQFTARDAFFSEPPPPLQMALQRGVEWMLGGPLPSDLLIQARGGGRVLLNLSATAATRALMGTEAFWARYRVRFAGALSGERADWREYFQDPKRQVELVLASPSVR